MPAWRKYEKVICKVFRTAPLGWDVHVRLRRACSKTWPAFSSFQDCYMMWQSSWWKGECRAHIFLGCFLSGWTHQEQCSWHIPDVTWMMLKQTTEGPDFRLKLFLDLILSAESVLYTVPPMWQTSCKNPDRGHKFYTSLKIRGTQVLNNGLWYIRWLR